jgi:hypothetical protein
MIIESKISNSNQYTFWISAVQLLQQNSFKHQRILQLGFVSEAAPVRFTIDVRVNL